MYAASHGRHWDKLVDSKYLVGRYGAHTFAQESECTLYRLKQSEQLVIAYPKLSPSLSAIINYMQLLGKATIMIYQRYD